MKLLGRYFAPLLPGSVEKRVYSRSMTSMLLQWHITEQCNLRCFHCYQEDSPVEEAGFREWLDVVEQFKVLLQELSERGPARRVAGHVAVTGGEPFLHTEFPKLLEFLAARKEFTFSILTNGTLLDGNTSRWLARLKPLFVQVSIDGGRNTHDQLRGPDSFERAVSGIQELVKAGVETYISFTAHKENVADFPEVVRLGRRLGVAKVWSDRFIPWGRGEALHRAVLSPAETRDFYAQMAHLRRQSGHTFFSRMEVSMNRALQFLWAGGRPYSCTAGARLLALLPNGDVFPCRRLPIFVGNIRETALAEIYFKNDLLIRLRDRDRVYPGCEGCAFARACGGGLRCLSYSLDGTPFRADPGCWLANTNKN